ncbi:S8 family serine peptidase [Nonlabens dokdonensis]|uniref:Peptidase S8 and S53, subtilisin, kexin, sedolisin n=2 Tax=Nonlabens dokdonensis TaxID=328515 RepID=L7WA70_NONDD|nr:S8 family serine peptidase [Nonlabens dokdonensis]AGC77112.1 peptidase S8 and S53, subtilisin, kexin, sedolisin [Nonlabens dokdonensis DSW-6]
MKINLTLVALFLSAVFVSAQTAEERAQIIKSNNQVRLQQMIVDLQNKSVKDQERALEFSRANNIPMFVENEDGSFDQLMRVTNGGVPVYYSIDNTDAANSTRTDRLHNGGSLGLNIEGQGMTAYVWDGGPTRISHQEFSGQRASRGDAPFTLNGNSFHATHVSGTIAGSGANPSAKGMAPQAEVVTNDWNSDEAEMAAAGANGALISNHSYGVPTSSLANNSDLIGKYLSDAAVIDDITFNAPYYQPVFSAGNSGSDNTSNTNPIDGVGGFDKLTFSSVSKNAMLVANAQDANIGPDGNLTSVTINFGSSQGPTDDLRIKPDITGNGTGLTSSFDSSDTAYGTISGTSMSAPNVAGSMLLLQQYYNEVNGIFMRAATVKGLTMHTADDAGPNGPDATWGWGLMNTLEAANVIQEDLVGSRIVEAVLQNGQTYTIDVEANSAEDLLASISWTDPAGQSNSGGANDATPALVNDLDIRISQGGTTFEPWKLTGVLSNGRGDNLVDNFERVDVASPSGIYTITVSHKGTLANGSQPFSLIVTGEQNDFAIRSSASIIESCNDQNASFPLQFLSSPSFNGTVNLSLSNVPSGVNASFSNSSFTSTGNATLDITGLNGAADGTYPITINAVSPTEQRTFVVTLRIISNSFSAISTRFPLDGATQISTAPILEWDDDLNAQRYQIQMARNNGFGRPFVDEIVTSSSFRVPSLQLDPLTTYFWRVKPLNDCGEGTYVFKSFTTFECSEIDAAVPSPISIPDDNATGITSSITVNQTNNISIGKVTVEVISTHEYSGDLLITLTSPTGTTIALTSPNGCDTPNLGVTFDDDAGAFSCNTVAGQPGYVDSVAPVQSLSAFNGESVNGTWTLGVQDRGPADLGTLNNWKITFCEVPTVLSNNEVIANEFKVYPNPSNGLFTIVGSDDNNSDKAVINVLDLNGRVVFTKEVQDASRLNESIDVQNLSNGLYLLQVQQGASRTVTKIIIDK